MPAQPVTDVDWALVAALRAQASEQLSQAVAADRGTARQGGPGGAGPLDRARPHRVDRGRAGQRRRHGVVAGRAGARSPGRSSTRCSGSAGSSPWSTTTGSRTSSSPATTTSCSNSSTARWSTGPPVADSDEELIDFLVFLASRSEVNARGFSEAQPRLHLRLDGGARLAAAAWVTPRPSVVIRRHRLMEVTLDDLVDRQMLTPVAASFLRAAVRARKSIVVVRQPGRGQDHPGPGAVRRDRPAGGDRHLRDRVRAAPARARSATRSSTPGRPARAPASAVSTAGRPASSPSTRRWSTPSASTSPARSSARSAARRSGR